ncbi:uncharacterized protein A1O9_04307 [Exophiala aquamarina CBS 119918]|uniref:Uncharacterized protein n=1 Tax=Exophiala aquamarina CBS 119918 TaxID=1182545 RepID=A0A072PJH5_9EURO|nr:uncharacterized protein A1O9_04307 [Exophiala aquamarina CBS 119918]KEF59463.1 hypothetical protein A1O9_04307 [Exophiala aquamarina CBS 119918]
MRLKPSMTWIILSIISLAPYIALPLSGFTVQLTTGYATGMTPNSTTSLLGQRPDNFLDQTTDDVFTRALNRWRFASPAVLPSRSAYYVPADNTSKLDRSWLQSFPNEWPDDQQVTTFIAPQSRDIINGHAWGLEVSLNCTVVSSLSQFKLLSQRNKDGSGPRCPPINFNSSNLLEEFEGLPDLCDFDVYQLSPVDNETFLLLDPNLYLFPLGMMEMAVQYKKDPAMLNFSDSKSVLLEAALWQNPIEMTQNCPPLEPLLTNDLGVTVAGFQKSFALNEFTASLVEQTNMEPKQLDAVGFQCKSSFRTGTATIDGRPGTYSSFTVQEADAILSATPVPLPTAIPRIFRSEVSAALNLLEMNSVTALDIAINNLNVDFEETGAGSLNPMAYIASNASWLQNIYRAVNAFYPQPLYCDTEGNVNVTLTSSWQQLQLLNSSQFLASFIRAHKAYALEMTRPSTSTVGNTQVTESWAGALNAITPTLIIAPGDVPPQIVVGLLAFWALGCLTLGLTFGLRHRWSETLDGFSMFRFGSDNPHFNTKDGRRGGVGGGTARHYTDCPGLRDLPGLVGDSRPDRDVGYITLVEDWRGVASRRKKYL